MTWPLSAALPKPFNLPPMKLLAFTVLLTLFIYFLADGPNLLDILNNY